MAKDKEKEKSKDKSKDKKKSDKSVDKEKSKDKDSKKDKKDKSEDGTKKKKGEEKKVKIDEAHIPPPEPVEVVEVPESMGFTRLPDIISLHLKSDFHLLHLVVIPEPVVELPPVIAPIVHE